MQAYQREFIRFAIERGVLRFGEFKLKSGRTSPYFFNAGLFNSGSALARLGDFYAAAVMDSGLDFDVVFGPAYKGIPLAAATAIALAQQHDRDLPWCFNRKEAKDHGEGGTLVGAPLTGRVLIVDDVITACPWSASFPWNRCWTTCPRTSSSGSTCRLSRPIGTSTASDDDLDVWRSAALLCELAVALLG